MDYYIATWNSVTAKRKENNITCLLWLMFLCNNKAVNIVLTTKLWNLLYRSDKFQLTVLQLMTWHNLDKQTNCLYNTPWGYSESDRRNYREFVTVFVIYYWINSILIKLTLKRHQTIMSEMQSNKNFKLYPDSVVGGRFNNFSQCFW